MYLSQLIDSENFFVFNIEDNDNSKNNTTLIHRENYRKTSSGLSGGVIAGTVIACAVVLIVASIVGIMVRKTKAPLDNSSSIVDLRIIVHYSQ